MSEETKSSETTADALDLPAFYGVKAGMTRLFDSEGNHIPATVVKLIPNVISQVKTKERDGYEAYQLAYNEKRQKLINKPTQGQLSKAKISEQMSRFSELRCDGVTEENLGKKVSYGEFAADTYVDVTGMSKGKGFQGVMKKFGFRGGPASHGSHFHRGGGSIGNRATPGKVFKLKKMPGHLGSKKQTIQNLKIIESNPQEGYILVKGSIPGGKNSIVRVAKALKR